MVIEPSPVCSSHSLARRDPASASTSICPSSVVRCGRSTPAIWNIVSFWQYVTEIRNRLCLESIPADPCMSGCRDPTESALRRPYSASISFCNSQRSFSKFSNERSLPVASRVSAHADYFPRLLVLAHSHKSGVSEVAVRRPFDELELASGIFLWSWPKHRGK